ncbi:MAG TPA: ribosome maturation factor RimM [Chloroflexia bacterium]|jgi:16S rRNA processing protein RimM
MSDETPSVESDPKAPEHLIVGQVVAPFGVRGELKVNILTEFPDRFKRLEEVRLAPFSSIEPGLAPSAALDPSTVRPSPDATHHTKPLTHAATFKIESTHIHKGQLIMKVEGVDSANEAEALRGCWLLVPREQARKLPRGSYYIYQLVGLDVVSTSGEQIGKIEDVLTMSANDIYVVKGPGVQDPTGELLVPAIKAIVKHIELRNGRIVIAPPEEWS